MSSTAQAIDAPRWTRREVEAPGGATLSVDHGAGEGAWRVVVIPGAPSRRHMTARLRGTAPREYEVVAPLRAGYGGPGYGADARPAVLDFDDQVAALRPLISAGERKSILIGISYGGLISLGCALAAPERVAGVVLVAPFVTEPRGWVRAVLPLADVAPIRAVLPRYLKNARAEVDARRPQVAPLLDRLGALARPVILLHGDIDALVPLSDSRLLAERLPAACAPELRVARLGGHYLELERPRWIWSAVRCVIARAEARAKTANPLPEACP
ncbi:MAG: alpha/beta fold hydrolase [Parvularculaceae bacterium]